VSRAHVQYSLALAVAALTCAGARAALAGDAPTAPKAPAAKVEPAAPAGKAAAEEPKQASTVAVIAAPLFSDVFAATPVAKIEDEVITLRELTQALSSTHMTGGVPVAGSTASWQTVLDRLVTLRLMVVEARTMDLDDLPEVKQAIEEHSGQFLREYYKAKVTDDVKPDAAEVSRLLETTTREWKLVSASFKDKADADAVAKEIAAGKPFDAVVAQAVADKKADPPLTGDFVGAKKLLPEVVAAVEGLAVGAVSAPVKAGPSWALLRVVEIRNVEDAEERAKAEGRSVERLRTVKLRQHFEELSKKNAQIDRGLLKRVDLEAKVPGLEALAKDKRAFATIKGEAPITVGEVVLEISKAFFHGPDSAVREKRVNLQKEEALDKLLYRRLFLKAAIAAGLKDSEDYRVEMREFTQGLLVDVYAKKVIVPEIKVTDEDSKQYYDEHKSEFTTPQFFKLQTMGFRTVKSAQAALEKFRAGTDWAWMRANAEDQLAEADRKLELDGATTLSANTLDPGLAEAVAGTKAGDLRLYKHAAGGAYVVLVKEQIASALKPLDEVRSAIGKKVMGHVATRTFETWGKKLREHYRVRIYLTRIGNG